MADILPRDLPAAGPIDAENDVIIIQQTGTVRQTSPSDIVNETNPVATEAEAQAGTDNAKRMTPLRVKQSIAAETGTTIATYAQGQLADSAVQPSRIISAGDGLTGGGTLAENRTIALNSTSLASLALADSAVQPGDLATVATSGEYEDLQGKPNIGEFARDAIISNDWNSIAVSGIYRTGNGLPAEGAPTTNINMMVEHVQGFGLRAWQLARQADPLTVRTWQRFRGADGIWGEWVEGLSTQNTAEVLPAATLALDWNAIDKSGFYRGSGNAGETIGAPTTNAYMTVFHLQGQVNAAMQIASQSGAAASATRWMRSRSATSGEWGEWVEIKTSGNTGEFNPAATQALDWNVITKSGFYRGANTSGQTVGAPATNAYMNLLHIQGQGTASFQLASTSGSAIPRQWVRSRTVLSSGAWSEWSELVKGDQAPTPQGLMPGGLYRENSAIKVIRPESQFYGQTSASVYNNSASELHGHYDQMIADFPNYVTKELLGQDNFGNDIFEYTFAAPPLRGANQTAVNKAHPKIVVVNAVHPDEKYSIVGNLCFFDDLCRNWQQDERLADLRWGAKIVLLAVANPSGVNANTRLNAAGVNIGRNLSYDWENNDSPQKGPGPLSEPESQYIAQLAVRHPEACAFIDHHGHAGQHLTWIGARLDKAFTIAKHTARINGAWSRRFVPGLYDDNSITAVTSTTIGGPPCEWAEVFGKNAFLLESAETTGWSGLSRRDNHRVIVESLLCLIHENWRRESETRGYVDP